MNGGKIIMSEYLKQANDFAKKFGVKLKIVDREYGKHFSDDKEERWRFKCKLIRHGKSYTFWFGQSIAAGDEKPNIYDVLSCLDKYESRDFDDFCSNYGYDNNSIKALKTYKLVEKEYENVERLFGDCMEELREIQ